MNRISRYIKGCFGLQLTFRGPLTALTDYTNAYWACEPNTWRSTSDFVFDLRSDRISWSSKRQLTVASSSCEAKYLGQTEAAKEAVWLRSLLEQLSPMSSSDCNSTSNTKLLSTQTSTLLISIRFLPPNESGYLPDTNSVAVPSNGCSLIASHPCLFI